MMALFLQNMRYIWRTKFLAILFFFTFIIHYVGVKLVHSMTIYLNGVISNFDSKDTLFLSLLFQLFTGTFLCAVYGIWMVPYAHEGNRTPLTFTLPVSKWKFPFVYAVCMLFLLLVEHGVMVLSFGMNFGWEIFHHPDFPWSSLAVCIVLESLAFEAMMFAFAVCSMIIGQIPTFFLGSIMLFLLQIGGVIFRINWGQYILRPGSSYFWSQKVYSLLPPAGELVVDLRQEYMKPVWAERDLALWGAWLLVFGAFFWLKLKFPNNRRTSE